MAKFNPPAGVGAMGKLPKEECLQIRMNTPDHRENSSPSDDLTLLQQPRRIKEFELKPNLGGFREAAQMPSFAPQMHNELRNPVSPQDSSFRRLQMA